MTATSSAGAGSIAIGSGAQTTTTAMAAVAVGPTSTASGLDAVAVGNASSATADCSMALGQGSVADQANTVSIGATGAERRLTNVAAGTSSTDAVNFAQLSVFVSQMGSVDGRLGQLESKFDRLSQLQKSSTAVAVAMGGAVLLPDSSFSLTTNVATNVATYYDAHAGALQLNALVSKRVAFNAGIATGFNKQGKTAGRVGITIGS